MRFRFKLMLSYMLLILLIAGSYYLSINHILENNLVEESRATLISQTGLVRLLVENETGIDPQMMAEKVGNTVRERVTLIARDGRVIGDSEVGREKLAEMQNHLDRPEVREAMKSGMGMATRYSETLRTDMLYVAMPYDGGETTGYVRLAMPLSYLDKARSSLRSLLGGATAITLLAALLFSYVLSNLTSRPLRDMAAAAARIGRGETRTRIAVSSRDELGELAGVLNEMAERTDNQMQRLSAEKQQLDTILAGMGEGVLVTTPEGVITLVNPAFRRQFAITGPVEGKKLIEISRHPDLLAALKELNVTVGGELVREITVQPGNMTLLTHWAPLKIDGKQLGVVAVFHDISDMKQVENMRRDFVANVSHELRTPVAVIKGYAETLLDGTIATDPVRSQRFVEIILNHSERLASLINDILTLSTLESKDTLIELYPLDIAGTTGKACMLLEENARKKGISLACDIPEGLPRVMADQGRLEQVLINLLDNAIKYTPEQGTVTLSAQRDDEHGMVQFSVTDTGIGIPLKDIPRIFERFYRVEEARSREQGGTGLGLAIVKHIVQLHGGEVSVTSEQGRGSVFSFTLRAA